MLSPDLPSAPWILLGVVIALVILLAVRAMRKDRREYQRFKRYRSTKRRQAMYRKWLRESFLTLGGLSAVLLLLVWQYIPLLIADINGWRWLRSLRAAYENAGWVAIALTVLLAAVVVLGPILVLFLARREDEVLAVGDIQALLPRNRAEVRLGAVLSLNAGVVEELLFRLALPALLYGAFGNAVFALVASALFFGGLHGYQGFAGIIGASIIGAAMLALYIASGTILVPIIAHILIDLRSFVWIPLIVLRVPRET